jgi:hypothetical protein
MECAADDRPGAAAVRLRRAVGTRAVEGSAQELLHAWIALGLDHAGTQPLA